MHAFLVFPMLVMGSLPHAGQIAASHLGSVSVRTSSTVRGDTVRLTLAEVSRLARTHGLDLDAERRLIAMAGGDLRQAKVEGLNPSVGYQRFESTRSGRPAEFGVTLSQSLGWLVERGPRVGAARAALDRTVAEVDDVERLAVRDAGQRFVAALAANRRLALAEQIAAATQRLYDITRIQLREGEISLLEANLAEIEYGRAEAKALAAGREVLASLLELRRLTGLAPMVPIVLVETPDFDPPTGALPEDSLVTVAIQRRPDVTARRLAVEEASLRQRLARREGMPVPSLNGFLTRDDGESGSRLGLGVSLPVALLDRNQGRVDREAASLERARIRLEAAQLAVRLEVREARLAYLSASEESARLESRVLEPARANIALVDSAYRAGKLGLPTLLLLRNQLVEAELDYWQAWQARREALLRLRAAVGLPAAPDDPTTTLPPKDTP